MQFYLLSITFALATAANRLESALERREKNLLARADENTSRCSPSFPTNKGTHYDSFLSKGRWILNLAMSLSQHPLRPVRSSVGPTPRRPRRSRRRDGRRLGRFGDRALAVTKDGGPDRGRAFAPGRAEEGVELDLADADRAFARTSADRGVARICERSQPKRSPAREREKGTHERCSDESALEASRRPGRTRTLVPILRAPSPSTCRA